MHELRNKNRKWKYLDYLINLHLYFSSLVPRVKSTKPQTRSLKVMPFDVPPQAEYIYYKILPVIL